jgi:glycosyltransferase involved in cell wall biosynthesis
MYHGNLAAAMSSLFLGGIPVIWNVRHTPYGSSKERCRTGFMLRLSASLSHRPEKIIYNAQTSALQHEALGYRKEKRLVIPNGFDLQQFQPSERARYEIRDELGLPASTPLIGLIARYHPLKGHATFMRAAALLLVDHPEVHFLLAGREVDGSNVNLQEEICNCGMQGHVHLLGERTDISRVMPALDVATSSSYSEGFSNAIGEGMACGIPCVATDVGDSAFLVGDAGLVVPPRDPEALCEGWKKILDLDPQERRTLGENARARIQKMFGLDAIVSQYESLYEEVLCDRNVAR